MLKNLGQRIRKLRKDKNVTLVEMAKKTGVAQATLSRIETGTMTGTVESHEKIAEVLGIGLADLYSGVDRRYEEIAHQTAAEPRKVTHHTAGYHIELLTRENAAKKISPLLLTLQGEQSVPAEQAERGVEKFLFVIEGEIEVLLDKRSYIVKESETLYFDASLPHEIRNRSKIKTRVLAAVSPPKI